MGDIMKRSVSISVFMALTSLVMVSHESLAQAVPPNIRQTMADILTVNGYVAREIQSPLRRCKNQAIRKKIIDDYARSLTPNIARLVSDKVAAEAALVLASRELSTAQNAASAADAALAAIDELLRNLGRTAAQRIAAIDAQINQALREHEVALELREEEDDAWEEWKNTGTNDDDLDAAANRQFNNQPLTTRDREVLAALTRHRTTVDTLFQRVVGAENAIATFQAARQDAQNGIRQEESVLRAQRLPKQTEREAAYERVRAATARRDRNEDAVRSLTAKISRLTAVKAPPIHWACVKLLGIK